MSRASDDLITVNEDGGAMRRIDMESQYDEIKRLRVEVQSLKDANDRVQEERDALSRDFADVGRERDDMERDYRRLHAEHVKVIEERDYYRREFEGLKLSVDRIVRERDEWQGACNAKCQELAVALREVDRLRHQSGEARTQHHSTTATDGLVADNKALRAALKQLVTLI